MDTHATSDSVPAGWYLDPTDFAICRWWDGANWTNQTRTAPPATALCRRGHPNPVGTNSCFTCGATVERSGAVHHPIADAVAPAMAEPTATATPPADPSLVVATPKADSPEARPRLTGTLAPSQTRST